MVDGDQLNVVVDPLFVSIAERNIEKFNVVPLFYDAHKAPPEKLNYETIYNGLKRAHDYSSGGITSIGEISNMLTRLWNKDNPDRVVAAWLTRFNNDVIDGAKTGQIDHYINYPVIAKKISKAIGGKNGRLPHWFEFSVNGRRRPTNGKKKRSFLESNNSTMNRICAAFNDIGAINLHNAEIRPFNWEMFLTKPCSDTNPDMCQLFCEIDEVNRSCVIETTDCNFMEEKEEKSKYELLAHIITEEMTKRFGPLENSYPYIVRHLFSGKAIDRIPHKQMFWRVYGDIALKNITKNLEKYNVCPNCGMRYPKWTEKHDCIKERTGFFVCAECKKVFPRMNAKQVRCPKCQAEVKKKRACENANNYYKKMKEEKEQRSISSVSHFQKT